jgi:hypothetical protein
VWIQKKMISLLATTITSNGPAVRSLCARLNPQFGGGKTGLPHAQLIARQEMRMVRD